MTLLLVTMLLLPVTILLLPVTPTLLRVTMLVLHLKQRRCNIVLNSSTEHFFLSDGYSTILDKKTLCEKTSEVFIFQQARLDCRSA
jgi:hypothetical protein